MKQQHPNNPLQQLYIGKIVREEIYKNGYTFNTPEHLIKLIKFIQNLNISQQSLTYTQSLIKFYRLPITVCFRKMYTKFEKLTLQQKQPYIKNIKCIATLVEQITKQMNLNHLQEIKFFGKWGFGKQKFTFFITLRQRQFAKFISELNQLKINISQMLKSKQSKQIKYKMVTQFQSLNMGSPMNTFEQYFQSYIRSQAVDCIESIKALPTDNDEYFDYQDEGVMELTNKPPKRTNLQTQHLCCRTSFYMGQMIRQPESLKVQYKCYTFPFQNSKNDRTKEEILKQTICGFINAEGGVIYMGIKQTRVKERIISGIFLSQSKKVQFKDIIYNWMKDIKPDIGKRCVIKFVPIRNKDSDNYCCGEYVVKIIVEKGDKNQIYSYWYRGWEMFAFKTDNEVVITTNSQKILNAFRNKLENPAPMAHPLHTMSCKEPQIGSPVYKQQPYLYEDDEVLLEEQEQYSAGTTTKKQYEEVSQTYLIQNTDQQKLIDLLKGYPAIKISNINTNHLLLQLPTTLQKQVFKQMTQLISKECKSITVYSCLKINPTENNQHQMIKDIFQQVKNIYNIMRQKQDNVVQLRTYANSANLYLRIQEMGIQCQFWRKA